MRLANLESNMPRRNSNVFSIANTEIDVANITISREPYAKMIRRNEIARRITRNYPNEMQSHPTEE